MVTRSIGRPCLLAWPQIVSINALEYPIIKVYIYTHIVVHITTVAVNYT